MFVELHEVDWLVYSLLIENNTFVASTGVLTNVLQALQLASGWTEEVADTNPYPPKEEQEHTTQQHPAYSFQ